MTFRGFHMLIFLTANMRTYNKNFFFSFSPTISRKAKEARRGHSHRGGRLTLAICCCGGTCLHSKTVVLTESKWTDWFKTAPRGTALRNFIHQWAELLPLACCLRDIYSITCRRMSSHTVSNADMCAITGQLDTWKCAAKAKKKNCYSWLKSRSGLNFGFWNLN